MTAAAAPTFAGRGLGARLWAALAAAWAVVTGSAPHVLHHAGPLAGAALLAGVAGKAIFFVVGLVLTVPMLRRLYRHFETPAAPALAVVVFGAIFAFSTVVVAPRLNGAEKSAPPATDTRSPSDHSAHHIRKP